MSSVIDNIAKGLVEDCLKYSPPVAILRAFRAGRFISMRDIRARLQNNQAYAGHVRTIGNTDPLFFLSHRYFLAKGLSARQRAQCALFHYEYEVNNFGPLYLDRVYRGDGLTLWSEKIDGNTYDIKLTPGNDVLYEGGLSIVFHFNGERVCVVSYSTVPSVTFNPQAKSPKGAEIFVTRKQLASNHDYQKAFNKAFDRTTPAHLCIGALAGLAMAQGYQRFIGIEPEFHPSCFSNTRKHFDVAYTQFWESLSGRKESPFGTVVSLPLKLPSVDEMDAKARKRALARRQHMENVRQSVYQIMKSAIRPKPLPTVAAANQARHGWLVHIMLTLSMLSAVMFAFD
jgi:uncharacterized protein VirK/YbjX